MEDATKPLVCSVDVHESSSKHTPTVPSGTPGGISLEDLTERYKIPSDVLENEVSIDGCKKISTFLESWRLVAPYLGLSEGDVKAIERDRKSEEEKRLLMLQRWKQALAFKATYKKLINTLLSIKRADLAVKVCQTVISSSASSRPTIEAHLEGQYLCPSL